MSGESWGVGSVNPPPRRKIQMERLWCSPCHTHHRSPVDGPIDCPETLRCPEPGCDLHQGHDGDHLAWEVDEGSAGAGGC